ncbi:MAG: GNAT family N-acetyltransferase [Ktedonobacterales bacterium]
MSEALVVSLRPAQPEDAAALAELMCQLGYPTTAEQMAKRLVALLAHADYYTVVAEVEERVAHRVVGMIGVEISLFYELDGAYGHIVTLVVDETLRGKRIGASLVAEAERWAQAQGGSAMIVSSSLARKDTHRFYEQRGYHVSGLRFFKTLDATGRHPEK